MLGSLATFAQAGIGSEVIRWALVIVVVAAVVALVWVALTRMGVPIPDWVVQIFWIIAVAVIVILAILFIARFAGFG